MAEETDDDSENPFPQAKATVIVELKSVDAMFAKLLTENEAMRTDNRNARRHLLEMIGLQMVQQTNRFEEQMRFQAERFETRMGTQDKTLGEIKTQTEETNGRVNDHDKVFQKLNDINIARNNKIAGAILVVTPIGTALIYATKLIIDHFLK